MYLGNFQKFSDINMCSKATKKMAANEDQINLTIPDVYTIFNVNTGNAIKMWKGG